MGITSLLEQSFEDQEAEGDAEQREDFATQFRDLIPGECRAELALHFLARDDVQGAGADGRAIGADSPVAVTGEEIHRKRAAPSIQPQT